MRKEFVVLLVGLGLGLLIYFGYAYYESTSIVHEGPVHEDPSTQDLIAQAQAKIARKFKDQLETMEDIVRNTNSENRRLTRDLRKTEILLETFQAKLDKSKELSKLQDAAALEVQWTGKALADIPIEAPPHTEARVQAAVLKLKQTDNCNIVFAMFSVGPRERKVYPHQLYTPESVQMMHPDCPIVLLTDAVSDTTMWEELGSEVSVRRLDPARTSQLHNTSELMLFRHIMEL
eukprot:CAMPEP_0198220406 /NCGR_PEP_ID=MMETSP1445-20131203/78868_1 /TAXON_ID=36898 /ORGANISM="Pyramimonas sp., Strain CCMP2087" /LENGTH=232 /DNA_ID=CAMNT_0043898171 /DNA_START=353 /DNA_END=1047 /DNA_ORIENTATION=-